MNIILKEVPFVKIRANVWQLATGHVVGYGPLTAPGGLYYCFTCAADDCQHVATVDEAWMAGGDSAEIPFDGSISTDEPLGFDGEELTFVSGIEWPEADYGLEPWL